MNEAVAALLATDSLDDLESGLANRLGYDAEVTDNGTGCESTVWDCDGNLIGTGKGVAAALADAIVYLDSIETTEPDDGSAIEHAHWLGSDL
jgi:hypothetical protein